jgi:hypothetical protein
MAVSESADKIREEIINDCFAMKNVFQIKILSPNCVIAISQNMPP